MYLYTSMQNLCTLPTQTNQPSRDCEQTPAPSIDKHPERLRPRPPPSEPHPRPRRLTKRDPRAPLDGAPVDEALRGDVEQARREVLMAMGGRGPDALDAEEGWVGGGSVFERGNGGVSGKERRGWGEGEGGTHEQKTALEGSPNRRRVGLEEGWEEGGGASEGGMTWKADSMRWTTAHEMALRCGVRKTKSLQSASWDVVREVEESSVSIVKRTSLIW